MPHVVPGQEEGVSRVGPGGSRDYFNAVAGEYGSWYSHASPGGHALRERRCRLLELLDRDQTRGDILDVGCGPAVLTQDLLDRGYRFRGVDASPGMIEQCRRDFSDSDRAHFDVGDAAHLAFPDESFDTVVCLGVIDRVPDYVMAIREMVRVTKRGGTVLVSFPNLYSPYAAWKAFVFYPVAAALRPLYFRLTRKTAPPSPLSSFARLHTLGAAARLLEGSGAAVTDVAFYYFNVLLSPLDEWAPRIALRTARRLENLRSGPLKWLGAGFIVRAEKR